MLASLSATCQALKEREQTVATTTLVDANSVSKAIERDNAAVAKKLFLLWGRFVSLLPRDGKALCEALQTTWLRDQRAWWGGRLRSTDVRIKSCCNRARPTNSGLRSRSCGRNQLKARASATNRCSRSRRGSPRRPRLAERNDTEALLSPDAPPSNYRGPHLIVMQHGWYASSFDMRLLRAYALLLFPGAIVLSPQSNEDNSGGSRGPMGQRLAHEVHNFIKHRCPDLSDADPGMGRLSFVGHSAGSMIVRTALASPVLKPYLPKLHAFVSLSSSHCGNMFVPSTLISGGMWALQHLHQSQFMDELQLLDAPKPEDAFMHNSAAARLREIGCGPRRSCRTPCRSTRPRPRSRGRRRSTRRAAGRDSRWPRTSCRRSCSNPHNRRGRRSCGSRSTIGSPRRISIRCRPRGAPRVHRLVRGGAAHHNIARPGRRWRPASWNLQ